jgi:hypothetical protein
MLRKYTSNRLRKNALDFPIDDYKLLMVATLAMIPLLAVFKAADCGGKHAGVAQSRLRVQCFGRVSRRIAELASRPRIARQGILGI